MSWVDVWLVTDYHQLLCSFMSKRVKYLQCSTLWSKPPPTGRACIGTAHKNSMCVSVWPHPWHDVHSGDSHGGRFGLLRLVVCGQRCGDAVGRRHGEVTLETSLCGRRRGFGYKRRKKGDRIQYVAEAAASNVVMLSWKSALTQESDRKLPKNATDLLLSLF